MQKYHNTAQDKQGNIITTATISVFLANTGTLATLYQDNEIDTFNNPFDISDANYDSKGMFFFKAENGTYDIKIVNGSDTTWIYDRVLFDFNDSVTFGGNIRLADGKYLYLGEGSALSESGTSLYIDSTNVSGATIFRNNDSGGSPKVTAELGGAIPFAKLFYNDNPTFETSGDAFQATGVANAFTGIFAGSSTSGQSYGPRISAGTTSADEAFRITNQANSFFYMRVYGDGGLVVGNSVSGGNKGLGTINANAVYDDNVLLTDYVFDYHLDNKINSDDVTQAEQFLANTSVLDLNLFSEHWKEHRHLPSLPSRKEWKKDGAYSIGKLAQRLWETVELQAVHIDSLNIRIKQLEAA